MSTVMKDTTLIIDSKFILYKLFYQRRPINEYFKYIIEEWDKIAPNKIPERVIFVVDSSYSLKQEKYPFYKDHRDENKKKSMKPKDYELLQKYLQDYKKLDSILPYFGTVIHLKGYEADDLAYHTTKNLKESKKCILFTSDQDWTKLLVKGKVTMFHIDRNKNITYDKVLEEYGYTVEEKKLLDVFAGSAKENVSGVYKLGTKTFLKLKQLAEENGTSIYSEVLNALDKRTRGMKLPDDVGSLKELVDRNNYLLNFLEFESDEDKNEFFKQLNSSKLNITKEELELKFINIFGKMYLLTEKEKIFYGIT